MTRLRLTWGRRRRVTLGGWPVVFRFLRRYRPDAFLISKGDAGTVATVELRWRVS